MFKDLQIRWTRDDDYSQLKDWWKANRFPAPHKKMLPDNGKGGIMISHKGIDICAGFYYKTNSSFALCEYVVSNFEVKDRELRKEALECLYATVEMIAKADGFSLLFSTVRNENLIKRMVEFGWHEGSSTTEMIKAI
jgi:hypothetical protein